MRAHWRRLQPALISSGLGVILRRDGAVKAPRGAMGGGTSKRGQGAGNGDVGGGGGRSLLLNLDSQEAINSLFF